MTMQARKYRVIDREEVRRRVDSKSKDFHLWCVLPEGKFDAEDTIPGSAWVPAEDAAGRAKELGVRKDDLIITYCAGGPECRAAFKAAQTLASLGYTNVAVYEGGLKDWAAGGQPFSHFDKYARYDHARAARPGGPPP